VVAFVAFAEAFAFAETFVFALVFDAFDVISSEAATAFPAKTLFVKELNPLFALAFVVFVETFDTEALFTNEALAALFSANVCAGLRTVPQTISGTANNFRQYFTLLT
jgi:hypothetical protein